MNNRLSDFRILVVPGLHNSGPGHWQTRWEERHPAFVRVEQWHWDRPQLAAWSAQVGHMLRRSKRPTLLVAHSFGCLASVHRAALGASSLVGALLVAPADPRKFGVEHALPDEPLPIPSVVIGSGDDPWMPAGRAREWAGRWGSEFVDAGMLGHINADSGLGDWPFGLAQLARLAELVSPAPGGCCGLARDRNGQANALSCGQASAAPSPARACCTMASFDTRIRQPC
jgi:predicted alpha/beta hydrolase family esterase